jgi:hypothetical protein
MSIGKLLTERLSLLATEGSEAAGLVACEQGVSFEVAGEAGRAQLWLVDHDRYSVTLRELTVGHNGSGAFDPRAQLSAHAAEIARRLAFLEEPLAVWELDGTEQLAQLRSSPPQRDGQEVSYWEVTLRSGAEPGATIARYRWTPGMAEREAVAYPATFALIARIANGLDEALKTVVE